ncbi:MULTISPECIES: hypothetical protein [Haloferax]|uniref:Uncharacterized protein n=1 Tax=Haloferax marinum TaxID=2666143 RepID=A0A6A8G8D1_9EURY|nr:MULTISPECIES: hypothetical protein [Haloferax]KAB1198187.1 hypothetical protein Hfx1150_11945 [Haloferax sp. CBA1150]MRW97271.1 hypothetical protein [Haloferax marinum]
MSTDSDAAERRIMNQFGEESRIPFLNIEEGDVGVLIGFPLLGLFIAGLTGIDSLALPFIAGGFGLGAAVVYVAPDHLTAWAWSKDVYRYAKRPRRTFSAAESEDNSIRNEGGLANYTPFKPDERTQDLTNIERAWPGAGAIQRSDGVMEAFIEVNPGNMDFAMSDDWASLQDAGAEFANKELNSKLKFHATTRSFPVEQLTEKIEQRLSDEDVTQNPIFRELLEEYRETRPRAMKDRGTQQIRFFIGVEVSPLEVYDRFRDERTPAEKLTQIPVIGILFNPFVTRREDLTKPEQRARMFERLDTRIESVDSGFIQQAPGWSARRLSTVELFVLAMDFWNGREHDYDNPKRIIRNQPVIGSSRREDGVDA